MTALTIFRYLCGDPRAILRIAKTPSSFWVGLLFVFSAAIARIYDGQDILGEPWHLFVPFGASLLTATILFLMLQLVLAPWGMPSWKVLHRYRAFVSLYWMTAPLAWLYAIPVERFLSAHDSAIANVVLLGFVAAWRVILISRVAAVFYREPSGAFLVVMLFADTLTLFLAYHSIILVVMREMSGVSTELPESEKVLLHALQLVMIFGVLTWLIWFGGTCSLFFQKRRAARGRIAPNQLGSQKTDRSAWLLAFASILIWIPMLPFTQPAQQLRSSVEYDLCNGHIERGIETMSKHTLSDFPPFWAPPRREIRDRTPLVFDVLEVIYEKENTASWVREWYESQFALYLKKRGDSSFLFYMEHGEFDRVVGFFEKLPNDSPFLRAHIPFFKVHIHRGNGQGDRDERRQRLIAILTRLGERTDPKE